MEITTSITWIVMVLIATLWQPGPVSTKSSEADSKGARMACMEMSHMQMIMIHIEKVEAESNEDKPIEK
jgi:hypothetical protein